MKFPQQGFYAAAQSAPLWAMNNKISLADGPTMWGVRLNIPAHTEIDQILVSFVPDSFLKGTVEGAVYSDSDPGRYPIAHGGAAGLYPNGLAKISLRKPIAAESVDRDVLVAVKFRDITGIHLAVADPVVADHTGTGDCWSSSASGLPIDFFYADSAWVTESRYPLIALA